MHLPDAGTARRSMPISLTALIDVVFILLLFFMLSSTFTQWRSIRLDVDNPGASAATAEVEPLIVRLAADGTLVIDGRVIATADAALLAAAVEQSSGRPMVLEPVGTATTQQVITALERLRAAGATRLNLANAVGADE